LASAFVQVRGADVETVVSSPVVVFDSFGPGNTHTTTGWGVSGAGYSGGYRGQAEWFVPGISGDLRSVEVALFRHSGSGLSNFYLTQDNGGIPGPILEVYLNVLSTGGLLALNSVNQPLLDAGAALETAFHPFLRRLRNLHCPIVTAVNGPAAGAGMSFALMGDMILCAKSAYFLQAFRRIGLVPDCGSTWMLPRLVGKSRAVELSLLG